MTSSPSVQPAYETPAAMLMNPAEFEEVRAATAFMSEFRGLWFFAGGWAIDLFLDEKTREHEDIEIGIYRSDQALLQKYLRGWALIKIVGGVAEVWNAGELLINPIHEIHAERIDGTARHLEILLQDEADDEWVFRRDGRIRKRKSEVICKSNTGVPYLSPEIVLLYKAKNPREKDLHDFNIVWGRLSESQQQWLKNAIETIHPKHPWLDR